METTKHIDLQANSVFNFLGMKRKYEEEDYVTGQSMQKSSHTHFRFYCIYSI